MEYNYKIKHSRLGIASFVIFLIYFVVHVTVVYLEYRGMFYLSILNIQAVIIAVVTMLMSIVGAILGLVGSIIPRYGDNKAFAYLGLMLNGFVAVFCLSSFLKPFLS